MNIGDTAYLFICSALILTIVLEKEKNSNITFTGLDSRKELGEYVN